MIMESIYVKENLLVDLKFMLVSDFWISYIRFSLQGI